MAAERLLYALRIPIKEKAILWSNGGPPPISTDAADTTLEDGSDSDDESVEDDDNELNASNTSSGSNPFNTLLIDIDVVAKQLAEKFARAFGRPYLEALGHGPASNYTSAIQASGVSIISNPRFGNLSSPRAKTAADISKNGGARTNARIHMNRVSLATQKSFDVLIEAVDEVNRRPADRQYKPPRKVSDLVFDDPAEALAILNVDIQDAEDHICDLYLKRRMLTRQLNPSTTSDVETPTSAVGIVVGPRHHYDTVTMFEFELTP